MGKKAKLNEINDYDEFDTTSMIDQSSPKKLTDLGIKLPKTPPTTVISIRLPNRMLNVIRAYSSECDMPYQTVIKLFLQEEIKRHKL